MHHFKDIFIDFKMMYNLLFLFAFGRNNLKFLNITQVNFHCS